MAIQIDNEGATKIQESTKVSAGKYHKWVGKTRKKRAQNMDKISETVHNHIGAKRTM